MPPIFAVMRHGLRIWWKDRRSMTLGLLTPILLYLILVSVYAGRKAGIPQLEVAWVDEDQSLTSRQFVKLIESDGAVHLFTELKLPFENQPTPVTKDNLSTLQRQGKISLAVEVSPGFGEQVVQFRNLNHPFIKIYYDPTDTMRANMLKGLMTKAGFLLAGESWGESNNLAKLAGDPNADPHWRKFASLLGQAFKESRKFMRSRGDASLKESFIPISSNEIQSGPKENIAASQVLAGVAVIFLLFSVSRAGALLLDEKQSGTLKRLLSSPLSIRELVVGKLLSITLNGFAQISLLCLVGWAFFHVPVFHSPLPLVLMIFLTAACAASFGLFFASFCQTPDQVQATATLVIIAMSLIGGSMIPKFLLPLWAQRLSVFTLNGWAMDGFMNVLVRRLGFAGIELPGLMLMLLACVFLAVTFLLLPRRLYE